MAEAGFKPPVKNAVLYFGDKMSEEAKHDAGKKHSKTVQTD